MLTSIFLGIDYFGDVFLAVDLIIQFVFEIFLLLFFGSCQQWNLDITVHSSLAASFSSASTRPATAAAASESQKLTRYGPTVLPALNVMGGLAPRVWIPLLHWLMS